MWLKCSSWKVTLCLGKPRHICFLCFSICPGTMALADLPGFLHNSELRQGSSSDQPASIWKSLRNAHGTKSDQPQHLCKGNITALCSPYSLWMCRSDQSVWRSPRELIGALAALFLWLWRDAGCRHLATITQPSANFPVQRTRGFRLHTEDTLPQAGITVSCSYGTLLGPGP